MKKHAGGKPYFLLSFIPALAYWLLETYSTLEVALFGGILLGILEMILEKIFTGHVHTISKLNTFLILILGGISLLAKEGIWFKLQPTLTGVAISSFLLFKRFKGDSLMMSMLKEMGINPPLPEVVYKSMEWHMSLFLILFSIFMARVAIYDPTATWLFWKTAGFYIAFSGFMLMEFIYLRASLRKYRS
jgi:intracellular septation protein